MNQSAFSLLLRILFTLVPSFLLTLEMARANQSVEVMIEKKGSQNVLDEFQDSLVVCDE
jgi:hypothetical protein